MKIHVYTKLAAGLGLAALGAYAQTPAPVLDTKAAFMQIVTNYTFRTNVVIVTNRVVLTNAVMTTNYYNAQGQVLQPVTPTKPPIPGLIPTAETKPPAPDPAVFKARQLQAIRDLLTQGLWASSNKVSVAGSFTSNATQRIQIPQGVTSFDRKKSEALLVAMNLTAEKAAPEVAALLLKTAAQFKTDDLEAVIKGEPDAATCLFLATYQQDWEPQLIAMVRQAGVEPKLRESYSNVMLKGGGLLGSVLGSGPSVDIDLHVAQGLLRAISSHLTEQERLIRSNASARKTPALQEAFRN